MNDKSGELKVAPYVLDKLIHTRKVCGDCLKLLERYPNLTDEEPYEYVGELEECANDAEESATTIYNLLIELVEEQEEE